MIDRLILSAVLGIVGVNGLFPDPPKPLTASQLQVKGKLASINKSCNSNRKAKSIKNLCRRVKKHLTSSN